MIFMSKHTGTFLFWVFSLFSLSYSSKYNKKFLAVPSTRNFRMLSSSSPQTISFEEGISTVYFNVQIYGENFEDWSTSNTAVDVPIMLALYSSQTLLSDGCLNFSDVNYVGDTLTQDLSDTSSLNFPYFQVADYYVSTSSSISFDGITFPDSTIIATSCNTNINTSYGDGAFGLIGLGTQGQSSGSFSSIFSIYLQQDFSSGELILGTDSSYAVAKSLANSITADENWHVSGISGIQIGSYSEAVDLNMIFDINSNTSGFPLEIFQQIVESIASTMSIDCSNDTYFPKCSFVGEIKSFPSLSISIGDQTLVIPPEAYAYQGYQNMAFLGSVFLNMRAVSPNLTNESYVTDAYSNYIILDSNVLAYYYTVFDANSGNIISLYNVNRTDYVTIYILFGNAGLLLILGLCYFLTHINKRSDEEDEPTPKKPETRKKQKSVKKGRRAGLISITSPPMVENRQDYKNVAESERTQAEETPPTNVISVAELPENNKQSTEPPKVREFEMTPINLPK